MIYKVFSNKEISKFEILDMMFATGSLREQGFQRTALSMLSLKKEGVRVIVCTAVRSWGV